MSENAEKIENARRIIISTIQNSSLKVDFQCPTMVWDNTGQLYGVAMRSDVRMGDVDCVSEVSFTLNLGMTDEEISERVVAAIDAIYHRLLAKIVPKTHATQ